MTVTKGRNRSWQQTRKRDVRKADYIIQKLGMGSGGWPLTITGWQRKQSLILD